MTTPRMTRTRTTRRSAARPFPLRLAGWILAAAAAAVLPLHAQVNVLMHRYDGARVGANLSETTLTASNVDVGQFGKLYSYPVSGSVYAQPLYVKGVSIGGATHNVLYVATMNDWLYAFDADSPSSTPLWSRSFGTPIPITEIVGVNNLNIVGNV